LFAVSHSIPLAISQVIDVCSFSNYWHFSLNTEAVSTPTIIAFIILQLGESFINSKNNSGPKIELWGTLETIIFTDDLVFFS